jgi:RNA polymerase sigma-70 factor, ECF subfamily
MTREPIQGLGAETGTRTGIATDPDLAAVAAAQAEPARFATLYQRYVDLVYSYAFYQLGDHHDAEDATERTFLAALRSIGTFTDRGASFRAWLLRIARNTIANSHRSRFRRRTTRLDALAVHPAARDGDPEALTVRADELRHVRRALAQLPEDRRQVVILRFTEGLSTREISQVLDRSEGAVRVLLHRALRDLADRLPG